MTGLGGITHPAGGGAAVPDADATTKGKVALAGDLAGTADLPVVGDQKVTSRKLADTARTGGWLPSGAIAETVPHRVAALNSAIASGSLRLSGGIVVPGGRAVSSITYFSNATALNVGSNQWFCLVDRATLSVLATTIDDGATAWAALSAKTLLLATTIGGATPGGTWTPSVATEVYVGLCVVATTVPTITGAQLTTNLAAVAPPIAGISNGGLTGPASAPATVAAPAAGTNTLHYAYVS